MQVDTAVEAVDGLTRSLPGAVVCISVGVIKASGLQVCNYKIVDRGSFFRAVSRL